MLRLSWFDSYETRQAEQNLGVVCGGGLVTTAKLLGLVCLVDFSLVPFACPLQLRDCPDWKWLWSDSQITDLIWLSSWWQSKKETSGTLLHSTQHTNTWSEGSWTSRHRSCLSVLCQWRLSHWCKYHRLSHSLKLSGMNLTQHMDTTIKASKT